MIDSPSAPGKTLPATAIACAYSEHDFFTVAGERAERDGRTSDAQHYRRMAQDAIEQLRRTEELTL